MLRRHCGGVCVVYVLECADGTLYTGYTTDLQRRVAEHEAGEAAKYTRGRAPVEVVHVEEFESRSAALSREHEIKQLSRASKERLVRESPDPHVDRPDHDDSGSASEDGAESGTVEDESERDDPAT